MTARTWIGGGNDKASNSKDWSPNGVPEAGDTLTMNTGLMNITDNNLANDELMVSAGVINLQNADVSGPLVGLFVGDEAQINMTGTDTLRLLTGGMSNTSINLIGNSTWTGGFEDLGNLIVSGSKTARFMNTGIPGNGTIVEGNTLIDVAAEGSGNFYIYGGVSGQAETKLEFGSLVGSDLTVDLSGVSAYPNNTVLSKPILQIDQPRLFQASVVISNYEPSAEEDIDLVGLARADSYTFKNDMLSIYAGKSIIDVLRLQDNTAYGFTVEKTTTGVSIVGNTDPNNHPVGLPIHI